MIYKQIFPTRFPILYFGIQIGKLSMRTALMTESVSSLTYE